MHAQCAVFPEVVAQVEVGGDAAQNVPAEHRQRPDGAGVCLPDILTRIAEERHAPRQHGGQGPEPQQEWCSLLAQIFDQHRPDAGRGPGIRHAGRD